MNRPIRHLAKNRQRSRPWLLLCVLPYLVFATGSDLMHSASCPENLLLRWMGQRDHVSHVNAPRNGPQAEDQDDCPACLWAGHSMAAMVAPAAMTPGLQAADIRYLNMREVAYRAHLLSLNSRGPPLFA